MAWGAHGLRSAVRLVRTLFQVSEYQIARQRWQEHATVLRQASRGAALHGDGHGHDHEHGGEVNGHAHAHGVAVRPVQSVAAPPAYLWTDVAEALDADDGAVVPEAEDVEDAEASEVAMVAGFLRDARAAWQRYAAAGALRLLWHHADVVSLARVEHALHEGWPRRTKPSWIWWRNCAPSWLISWPSLKQADVHKLCIIEI